MDKIREVVAEAEHNQWWKWASKIAAREQLSEETVRRWSSYFLPYAELSEEVKDLDRKQADIVLAAIQKHATIQPRTDTTDELS